MRNPEYSLVNPNTGDVTYNGPLSLEKGDHSYMPSRTDESLAPDVTVGPVNQSNTNNSWQMEPILFNFILYTKTK